MREGINRRHLLKTSVAGAVAIAELVRARDAKADIRPETSWYEGIDQLIQMTERKGLEHGDKFMIFERGGTRWSDQRHERSRLALTVLPTDWKNALSQSEVDGPVSTFVDVHVHGNKIKIADTARPASKSRRGERSASIPYASTPSTIDLRSLFATHWLIDNKSEASVLPPRQIRADTMRITSLVLNTQNKQGWYYESFPQEVIQRTYPDLQVVGLNFSNSDPDFILRELALREVKDEFQEASFGFNGDVRLMRTDLDGESKYQALMRAYANLGVLLRHVTWEELQKEPPGAGVMYKKN